MKRTERRTNRKLAMQSYIRTVQTQFRANASSSNFSDELSHKLYAQQDYLAQQIGEAGYTEDSAKADAMALQYALADVEDGYARNVIKQMANSRRYWHIACYAQVWSL